MDALVIEKRIPLLSCQVSFSLTVCVDDCMWMFVGMWMNIPPHVHNSVEVLGFNHNVWYGRFLAGIVGDEASF